MNLVAVVFDFESLTEMPLDGLVENLEAFLSGLPGWILENPFRRASVCAS